jgi:hypothetical protein
MINVELLQRVRQGLNKTAYAPPQPEVPFTDPAMAAAQGAPQGMPMDPAMMQGMPMDPAMMQGMPPAMPAAPPVDPAMMAAAAPMGAMAPVDPMTGLPPMDPAAMAGMMPPGMPMDPAAMGAEPAAPETVQVSLDDLRAIFEEVAGEGKAKSKPAGDKGDLEERLAGLEDMMGLLLEQFGMDAAGQAAGMPTEMPPAGSEMLMAPQEPPPDFSLLEAPGDASPIPEAMPKQGSEQAYDNLVESLRRALRSA